MTTALTDSVAHLSRAAGPPQTDCWSAKHWRNSAMNGC